MNILRLTILIFLGILLTGCGGPSLYVTTKPAGADVYISDLFIGTTPIEGFQPNNQFSEEDLPLILSADGFDPVKMKIRFPLVDDIYIEKSLQKK